MHEETGKKFGTWHRKDEEAKMEESSEIHASVSGNAIEFECQRFENKFFVFVNIWCRHGLNT